ALKGSHRVVAATACLNSEGAQCGGPRFVPRRARIPRDGAPSRPHPAPGGGYWGCLRGRGVFVLCPPPSHSSQPPRCSSTSRQLQWSTTRGGSLGRCLALKRAPHESSVGGQATEGNDGTARRETGRTAACRGPQRGAAARTGGFAQRPGART